MEPVTTALAVAKLWATFEIVGTALLQGGAQEIVGPWIEMVNETILEKSGVRDRQRRKVFTDAYVRAEESLIEQIGTLKAYRTFGFMPRIVDAESQAERLLLTMLSDRHDSVERNIPNGYWEIARASQEDTQNLRRFILVLRANLFQTKEFSPIIQFCNMEESRQIRQAIFSSLQQLTQTIAPELQALRVVIVEPTDFDRDRELYLAQLEQHYQEQEFTDFPDLCEQTTPVLLQDIFVPLRLRSE